MAGPGHVLVVGGGIAGVSAAYYLAISGLCDRITLIEAEAQLAHHTTGRSAALLTENYGAGPIRPLTAASLDFLYNPPADLVDHPVLEPRGIITVATSAATHDELDRQLRDGANIAHPVAELDAATAAEIAPHIVLGPDSRIMYEEHAQSIDVAALHQAYVRGIKANGGKIETARRLDAARLHGDGWSIDTTAGPIQADVLVNAAGSWGDLVAQSAGIAPVGLQPLKRTAFMVDSPFEDSSHYPFVAEVHHDWYIGPDGTQFMCSPADEIPSEPCDARADEIDIARTIDMLNQHTRLNIRSVRSHWAGLRTFGPDRSMVIGPEPGHENFVWCVGQGGTGIQSSPGAGQLTADLVLLGQPGKTFDGTALAMAGLAPDRLLAT